MQDANDAGSPARKAPRASGGRVAQVLRQLEARDQVSPAPPARPLRSASQTPAATPRQNTGESAKLVRGLQRLPLRELLRGPLLLPLLRPNPRLRTLWQAAPHQHSLFLC